VAETINDSGGIARIIVRFYIDGVTVAILSKETAFVPAPAIAGFGTISPGMNLAEVSAIPGIRLTGTSSDADSLDGIDSTGFMRRNQNETTTGTVSVLNDTGLNVGVDSDLSLYVSGVDAFIRNQSSGGDLVFRMNAAGTQQEAGTQRERDVLRLHGNTGVLRPAADNTYDLGAAAFRFKTIYGVSTSALYADLAERFAADQYYAPGTVVELGGAAEVTLCGSELSESVFGVVSTSPAYLMNADAGTAETHPAIAVQGRVPVRVVGTVKKGDRLVSAGNGVARAATREELTQFNVIGRVLADKMSDAEELVEAVVQLNI
jgi:hypothetical protein